MVVLHIPYGYLDVHDGDGGHEACTQGEGDLQGQDNATSELRVIFIRI